MSLPVVLGKSGAIPQQLQTLRDQIVALATAEDPGLTANLPGGLIEDIVSTDVGALTLIDQCKVDLINSLTPYGANLFLLNQLGQIYGMPYGTTSNTSVYVEFTGTPGFLIPKGLIVSDGTYNYVVQDPTVVPVTGTTDPVYCIATISGSWAVPPNTVTVIASSVPSPNTLSVNNPNAGTPSPGPESNETYRSLVLQAGYATSSGMQEFIKTMLYRVPNVNPNLVSVRYNTYYDKWECIVGGGDPYEVANAIFIGCGDTSALCGSALLVTGITRANPGVITTNLFHDLHDGEIINITGIRGMTNLNNVPLTVTVIDNTHFSIGINTSTFNPWVCGGLITPNPRNHVVTINNDPDIYEIPFVVPLQQAASIIVEWNASTTTIVSNVAVANIGTPIVVTYINSLKVGEPISFIELQSLLSAALHPIIPVDDLIYLNFEVYINGFQILPATNSEIVQGDIESYYFMTSADVGFVRK